MCSELSGDRDHVLLQRLDKIKEELEEAEIQINYHPVKKYTSWSDFEFEQRGV